MSEETDDAVLQKVRDKLAERPNRLASIAGQINDEWQNADKSYDDARLRIGRLLNEAKALVKHGEWVTWFAANITGRTLRDAQKCMAMAGDEDPVAAREAEKEAAREGMAQSRAAKAPNVRRISPALADAKPDPKPDDWSATVAGLPLAEPPRAPKGPPQADAEEADDDFFNSPEYKEMLAARADWEAQRPAREAQEDRDDEHPDTDVFARATEMARQHGGRQGPAETRWWHVPGLLEATPINRKQAQVQYNALGWLEQEVMEPLWAKQQEYLDAKAAVLEGAQKFFPTKKAWKAWVDEDLRTCPASSAEVYRALTFNTAERERSTERYNLKKEAGIARLRREFPELAALLETTDKRNACELIFAAGDIFDDAAKARWEAAHPATAPTRATAPTEAEPAQLVDAFGDDGGLMPIWRALKRNPRLRARAWVEQDRPIATDPSEHFVITEALVPFRTAAAKATDAQLDTFLAMSAVELTEIAAAA